MKKILLKNDFNINVYESVSDEVVVLVHGASEGASRYHNFATILNQKYNVITYNHPGHETGSNVKFEYSQILEETSDVIKYAHDNYSKVTIFAHSMGSLVVRNILSDLRSDVKLVLSGAPVIGLGDKISSLVAMVLLQIMDLDATSTKLNYLIFDQKSSKKGLNNKNWISSDSNVVTDFVNSTINNKQFTNVALKALLKLTLRANTNDVYRQLNDYQLLLVSGAVDCFTNDGQNYKRIKKYATTAKVKIYPDSYHEVHNDVDKKQLVTDIINFIEKDINGKN